MPEPSCLCAVTGGFPSPEVRQDLMPKQSKGFRYKTTAVGESYVEPVFWHLRDQEALKGTSDFHPENSSFWSWSDDCNC